MTDCCRDCHFLTKHTSAYGIQSWDKEDRDLCRPKSNINNPAIPEENRRFFKIYKVGCYKNEWERSYDEFADGSSRQSLKEEILRDREGQCFFVEYPAGTTFPEALERYHDRNEKRDRKQNFRSGVRNTVIGVVGLVIAVIIAIMNG